MSLADTHPRGTTFGESAPLPAPPWACRSVPDSGGIVHETNSYVLSDAIRSLDLNRDELVPAEVAMSASDQRVNGQWQRTSPTIQIEGGSYSLDAARRLCVAVGELLDVAADRATT